MVAKDFRIVSIFLRIVAGGNAEF